MRIQLTNRRRAEINPGMMGLFFEDINYEADGGLYAEMIENRSFEFVEAFGDKGDYYTVFDGGWGWKLYPESADASISVVSGSPMHEENPHYLRLVSKTAGAGFSNQAYSGICLKEGEEYRVKFYARRVKGDGALWVHIVKDGTVFAEGEALPVQEERLGFFWRKYELVLKAEKSVKQALFTITMEKAGIAEFDFVSMMPCSAVAGVFRADLFELLKELRPGFIRFPGGCIVEGNTLSNRYRYKDTLTVPQARRGNWNRWAVHGNCEENGYHSRFSHYNQTYGLGYYEYFLLCELLGAKALPVMNVGMACQYQSFEFVGQQEEEFQNYVQDAIDLITFANGDVTTRWGAVRAALGHPQPFGLEFLGIGNEQWQTEQADFFSRYEVFEKAIHAIYPEIRLIGSAGPDVTSERFTAAWNFYESHGQEENFVYAVDEHYYMRPEWFLSHTDFYDSYPRSRKVFSGEYAAHPENGRNTLEGALAEAAFLTGVERNADVVLLSSYAPLFGRHGFDQWRPDLIWFDEESSYGTPSYWVQKMYSCNMGNAVLDAGGLEKEAAKAGIYFNASADDGTGEVIVKIVNLSGKNLPLEFELDGKLLKTERAELLGGPNLQAVNSIEKPQEVHPLVTEEAAVLADQTFAVYRLKVQE